MWAALLAAQLELGSVPVRIKFRTSFELLPIFGPAGRALNTPVR